MELLLDWTPRLQAVLRTRQVFEPLLRVAGVEADTFVVQPVAVDAVVVVVAAAEIVAEESSDVETLLVAAVMKKSADLLIVD